MTKLGIVTDIHADWYALQNAIQHMKAMGCTKIVCAGDIIDGDVFPDETVKCLIKHEIPCVFGNHEKWSANDEANCLSDSSRKWLNALPRELGFTIDGVKVAVFHGSPKNCMDGIHPTHTSYADLANFFKHVDCAVMIVGHTHLCFEITLSPIGQRVINPGALYTAPPHTPSMTHGVYGVLELPSKRFNVYRARDGKEMTVNRVVKQPYFVVDRRAGSIEDR